MAAAMGHNECVRLLIEGGANKEAIKHNVRFCILRHTYSVSCVCICQKQSFQQYKYVASSLHKLVQMPFVIMCDTFAIFYMISFHVTHRSGTLRCFAPLRLVTASVCDCLLRRGLIRMRRTMYATCVRFWTFFSSFQIIYLFRSVSE